MIECAFGNSYGYATNWDAYVSETPYIVTTSHIGFEPIYDPHVGWESIDFPKKNEHLLLLHFYREPNYNKSKVKQALDGLLANTFYGNIVPTLMLDLYRYKHHCMISSFYTKYGKLNKNVTFILWGNIKNSNDIATHLMYSYSDAYNEMSEQQLIYYVHYTIISQRKSNGIHPIRKASLPSLPRVFR